MHGIIFYPYICSIILQDTHWTEPRIRVKQTRKGSKRHRKTSRFDLRKWHFEFKPVSFDIDLMLSEGILTTTY